MMRVKVSIFFIDSRCTEHIVHMLIERKIKEYHQKDKALHKRNQKLELNIDKDMQKKMQGPARSAFISS